MKKKCRSGDNDYGYDNAGRSKERTDLFLVAVFYSDNEEKVQTNQNDRIEVHRWGKEISGNIGFVGGYKKDGKGSYFT